GTRRAADALTDARASAARVQRSSAQTQAFAAAGFRDAAFFAAGFLAAAFFAAGFVAAGLAAAFFAAGFLAAGFFAAGFLAAGFFAAGFRAAAFLAGSALRPPPSTSLIRRRSASTSWRDASPSDASVARTRSSMSC